MTGSNIIRSPDTLRKDRIPPGQRLTSRFPVLHYGDVPHIDTARWKFTIRGLLDKERTLDYEQFLALPRLRVFSDIHCVTKWSKLDNLWEGPGVDTIKQLAAIQPEARFVIIHAAGGFTANLSLEDFFQPDVLFVLKYDNQPLSPEHGWPVRLVVPRLYLWKSAKWVTGVEFTHEDHPGFWETRGYHHHGDPWREERYSG